LLSGRHTASRRDVQEILATIFQVEMGLGTVSYQEAQVSAALQEPVTEAQVYAQQQHHVNTDETGWAKNQERCWLWTAATVTVFLLLASRSSASLKQLLGERINAVVGQLLLKQAAQMFAPWYRIRDGTLSRPDFQ
jgi:transposase